MQAIILAAGMGKRLKELTKNNTKCMVKVNGVTLIERMLRQLDSFCLKRVVIVVGYQSQSLIDYIQTQNVKTPIVFVDNPVYDKTNNIYSLSLAKDYLAEDDTLLLESDLIFEDRILDFLINDPREDLALVDKYESWMDGTCVELGEDDSIESFIPGKKLRFDKTQDYYKTVNIYKFSKSFSNTFYIPFLMAYQTALGENEYYEQALRVITMLDKSVLKAKKLTGQKWYEIDDIQDLDIAESIFSTDDDERVKLLQERYGGYWRYPDLLDFCYLVNPFYPTTRMKDELKASFNKLLTEYPSGMRVNSLLAAKNFNVKPENILVGNGAAELIKSLMNFLEGKTGFIRPTFDEYPHRYERINSVDYIPEKPDYNYNADDLMTFFADKEIQNLILVNPDNPTGNYIKKADLLRLVAWSKNKGIRLVVDESFVDFADEENTLIDPYLLNQNSHLVVMKSISKSYGVPGLRLGVLASGDTNLINRLKKDVAIWNINSFAEFYLQIAEKYQKDYKESLLRLKAERARFSKMLSEIKGVRVIPSQANYVMICLDGNIKANALQKTLLIKYNLLVKELTSKTEQNYLRLAIRNNSDNDVLIEALKTELGSI